MKKGLKKGLKIAIISLLTIIALLIVAMLIIVNIIITPEKVTPIVNSTLAEIIDGRSEVKSVDISIFSSFPYLRIALDSLAITDSSGVDVITLEKLKISINPIQYLTNKRVVISNIEFNRPKINILTDKNGISNIQVFRHFYESPISDTTAVADTTSFKFSDYAKSIDITKITLNDGQIYSNNELLGRYISIKDISMSLSGRFNSHISDLEMLLACDSINYTFNNNHVVKNLKIGINTKLEFNRDSLLLTIDDATLDAGKFRLKSRGYLKGDREEMALITNLDFNLNTPSLDNLINTLPEKYIKKEHKFTSDGSIELNGTIEGTYNKAKKEIPSLDMELLVNNGKFKFEKMEYGVDQLDILAKLFIDGKDITNSSLSVDKLIISSNAGIDINSTIKATDIFGVCNINFDVNSDVNISKIREILPINDGITLKGKNTIHLKGRGRKNDIIKKNFGALYLSGKLKFNDLLLIVDGSKLVDTTTRNTYLFIQMDRGNLNFGSETKSVKESKNEHNLIADISFNGVGFKNKQGLEVILSNVDLKAKSKLIKDRTQVTPISGELILDMLTANLPDTLSSSITSSKITFSTQPSLEDKKKAVTKLEIRADTISLKAIPSNTDLKLNTAGISININPDSTKKRGYSIEGMTGFAGLKIFSPLFPIDISMKGSKVSFANNRITLSHSKIQMGHSNITATGWTDNLLGRIFGASDDKIVSDLSLKSDNIDFTELYNTTISANNYQVADSVKIDQPISVDSITTMQLIIIPKYIEAKLNVNLKQLTFGKHTIKNVSGDINVSDESIELNNLNIYSSNSKMSVSALYKPTSDSLAHSILDLKANQIVLADIIELLPSIDSLMPMLKSIEGVVDFEMVAKADLNNTMEFVLPSLESVMTFKGENLVLFDGETFATVSKMLFFKNKKRNLIDSLGLNVIIRKGGYIDVPPFEITIDRYRAIIGGTQKLDFNSFDIDYKYNISILKSPVPIKAGVDITGKNEDFDYKITKAKLKRVNFSSIQFKIDSIQNKLRGGL